MKTNNPAMTEKKPLEQLIEMNEQQGKVRRKPARKPKDVKKDIERYYRAQLKSLVREINREIEETVIPVVKQEKSAYKTDAATVYTRDAWADRIIEAIRRISRRFVGGELEEQYERLAQGVVSRAESATTEAFVKSVNQAVGVNIRPMLDKEDMVEYVQSASWHNAQLIKSVPEEYLKRVETAVVGGIRSGYAPAKIAQDIREATGVTQRRAELLARDQTAKLTSEITERRQRQAGIKYYQVITANDERVTGKPGGKYPNARISCWGIANQDIGYGKGVYRWDQGASWGGEKGLHPGRHHINCRCVAKPIMEWELPNKAKKNKT